MRKPSHNYLENQSSELIGNDLHLTPEGRELKDSEQLLPVEVSIDSSLRLKVLDQCGMACTFCHNEGTPVTVDNRLRETGDYTASGKSDRVSIFLGTNGANFVSDKMLPDANLTANIDAISERINVDEIHITGGEPTLHPEIDQIVRNLKDKNLMVKMTSNGERFSFIAPKLKEAGLDKVVFSIFGTTPEELAAVQGEKFNNLKFGAIKLKCLEQSIEAAHEVGIAASANIVMPDSTHEERIARVIGKFGDKCKIRILNSLDEGSESYSAIYNFLASIGATPIRINMTAGASGMSIDYILPDGKEIGFKQIRKSYLSSSCDDCVFKNNGCEEGYYGVRMYVDSQGTYRTGVCIQRMDLTTPVSDFLDGPLPEAINLHRQEELSILTAGA
jgi:GTP 3',8-cyclase